MTRILIIGIGNPLRGDDGLGWYAVNYLEEQPWTQGMALCWQHQLTPELAEPISLADLVIFIDACWGTTPGQVFFQWVTPDDLAPATAFTHHVDIPSLLSAARDLYHHMPAALLVTITGSKFGFQEQLSDTVRAALPELWDRLREIIEASQHEVQVHA